MNIYRLHSTIRKQGTAIAGGIYNPKAGIVVGWGYNGIQQDETLEVIYKYRAIWLVVDSVKYDPPPAQGTFTAYVHPLVATNGEGQETTAV